MGKVINATTMQMPAPLVPTSSNPVDTRIVVSTFNDLTNPDTYGGSGIYCSIYEGIQVYVCEERTTYTYVGPGVWAGMNMNTKEDLEYNAGVLKTEVANPKNWVRSGVPYEITEWHPDFINWYNEDGTYNSEINVYTDNNSVEISNIDINPLAHNIKIYFKYTYAENNACYLYIPLTTNLVINKTYCLSFNLHINYSLFKSYSIMVSDEQSIPVVNELPIVENTTVNKNTTDFLFSVSFTAKTNAKYIVLKLLPNEELSAFVNSILINYIKLEEGNILTIDNPEYLNINNAYLKKLDILYIYQAYSVDNYANIYGQFALSDENISKISNYINECRNYNKICNIQITAAFNKKQNTVDVYQNFEYKLAFNNLNTFVKTINGEVTLEYTIGEVTCNGTNVILHINHTTDVTEGYLYAIPNNYYIDFGEITLNDDNTVKHDKILGEHQIIEKFILLHILQNTYINIPYTLANNYELGIQYTYNDTQYYLKFNHIDKNNLDVYTAYCNEFLDDNIPGFFRLVITGFGETRNPGDYKLSLRYLPYENEHYLILSSGSQYSTSESWNIDLVTNSNDLKNYIDKNLSKLNIHVICVKSGVKPITTFNLSFNSNFKITTNDNYTTYIGTVMNPSGVYTLTIKFIKDEDATVTLEFTPDTSNSWLQYE